MTSIRPELRFTDIAEERGFYKRFLTLPEKPENIIRIADRGEYYTIVGEDAQFAAQQVYHTSSVLKKANCSSGNENNEPLTYVTMSQQVCLQFLKMCLFEYGYKIEIYDKSWKIIKRASPGNIEQIDDLLSVSIDSSIVLCSLKFQNNLNEGNSTIGCSFVDSSIYKLGMIELLDNEVYSNLESLIIQLGAKECLVPDLRENANQKKELEKITRVIDRCGCVVTFVKPSDFTDKDVDQDIVRLVGDELTLALPKYSKLCLSACNALLIYLNLMGETKNYGKYELIEHSLNQYMKLDASSLRALNIFPQGPSQSIATAGSSNHTKINSVFQLLNKCKTHSGVRLLHEWLKQPLLDLDELNKRHDLVEFLIDQLELRQILRDNYLPHVPDVRRITKKLNMKANLDEVLKLYTFVDKLPMIASTIKEYVADCGTNHTANIILEEWYGPLEKEIEPLSNFKKMVEDTIDLDHYEKYNEAIINCEAEEQLSLCKGKLDQHLAEVEDLHSSVAEDLSTDDKRLKLEKHHLYGWCFRLTRNDAKVLRGETEYRYYELSTVKAGVYFTTKDLERISKEIEQLEQQYDALQKELVAEVVTVALTYTPVLERISMILANVDVLCSFAHVSSYAPIPYVRPTMLSMTEQDTRKLVLQNSRHPVLEVQDDVSFISNDVKMERGTRDFLIITGPNMGGKSTYIRQIGVIVLMAQVGCFVPCDDAQISIMDSILCRVGAGDSQFKGVSTFMVEMLETSSILKNSTSNSLVIIDELGRGTSTYDGFGLAWSISEFIATKIKCFTLFATHFHELTELAERLPNIKNMQVLAHIDTAVRGESGKNKDDEITLLYKVDDGISDQSFGINVAEVVNFPTKIIQMAKRKASELEELKEATNEDDVSKKHCTKQEIAHGTANLKNILREWKKKVEQTENLDDMKAIENLLRDVYKVAEDDKYIRELIRELE